MGSGTYGRMAAALKNSVTRFQSDEDDPDVKAGYELFRRDISFIEGKDYFELDEVNRCIAKYMLRNRFMRYEPPTGIDRRLVITRARKKDDGEEMTICRVRPPIQPVVRCRNSIGPCA